jgi:transposase-like protein
MDFPIADLLDHDRSTDWLLRHFHPEGLSCPHCGAEHQKAYLFRQTTRSQLDVWRCKSCRKTYTLYTGTVFEARHLPPAHVVLLLRGVAQGVSSARLARELGLSRTTVHQIRKQLHHNAEAAQPTMPLPDARTEADEMFQNAGEKRGAPC